MVERHSENGIVAVDMNNHDEHLVVRWQNGVEKIHRSKIGEIRRLTESEVSAAQSVGASPLNTLERLEALDRIEAGLTERSRTIKSAREQRFVDNLIRRGFNPECEWDRKNTTLLLVLAIKPDSVGLVFKVRERLHRPFHWLHRRRVPE
jgi:hypothetical protein